MAQDPIYIESFYVKNVEGVEFFSAKAGAITAITGANETGKSSIVNGLLSVFQGGFDPDLIRRMDLDGDGIKETPCEQAEIGIRLSDGVTIVKTMKATGMNLDIKTPSGGVVRAPKTYIESLLPPHSFDPGRFIRADPKNRAEFLLKTLPLEFAPEEMNAALVGRGPGWKPPVEMDGRTGARREVAAPPPEVVRDVIDLQKFDELRDWRYDERTEVNRQLDELAKTISAMERELPAVSDVEYRKAKVDIQARIDAAQQEMGALESSIDLEAEQARNKENAAAAKELAKLDNDIADLRAKIAAKEGDMRQRVAAQKLAIEKINGVATQAKTQATEELRGKIQDLLAERSEADTQVRLLDQAEGVRNIIATRTKALEGYRGKSVQLTAIIEALDAWKNVKLKALPVEGLDIKLIKGRVQILIGGIPFDKLNEQRQIFTAIQFVRLASRKMRLILTEGAALDGAHLQALEDACKEAKIQLFVARWADGEPLNVRCE